MKTIRLYGELARKFGDTHVLAVKSPAEAVRAMIANFPEMQAHLIKSGDRGVDYQVKIDDEDIDEKQLNFPVSKEISFIPVIRGASSGTAKIIVGAVLVVAGILLTVYSAGTGAAIGGYMISAGIGLMLGGVIQLLTPVPKAEDPAESASNKPSYVFNGPVNTTAQGQPVPIGYGRLIVGGAVISAGVVIDDLSPPQAPPFIWTGK